MKKKITETKIKNIKLKKQKLKKILNFRNKNHI